MQDWPSCGEAEKQRCGGSIAVRDHFNQPTNRVILTSVGTFCSRLCGSKSVYFGRHPERFSSHGCGDKTRRFKSKHDLFVTLNKWLLCLKKSTVTTGN